MYKIGDKVSYSYKCLKATIVKVLNSNEYTIEFEDQTLIPPKMDVDQCTLSNWLDSSAIYGWDSSTTEKYGNKETNCPRCGNKWTETLIGHRNFYDCLRCNLKREDV